MYFCEKTKGYLTHENLRLLFRLRNIAIVAQTFTIFVALVYLQMALPLIPLLSTVGLLILFNIYTGRRITRARELRLSEVALQIGVDIVILTILLSLSGGASNPFAILYLLPLTISAILLPARVTWGISLLTVVCYSLLLIVYVPMPHAQHHDNAFNLHIVGMWLGFVLSAGVIAYFIVGLQKIIRKQAAALHRANEAAMKSEQLVKLGVLAAGAAHEMGTPLNTLSLELEDLEYIEQYDRQNIQQSIAAMREQIERCRRALANMSQSSGNVSLKSGGEVILSQYLALLLKQWQEHHPQTAFELRQNPQSPMIMVDEVLNVALSNLVDNAIEVSPDHIVIDVEANNAGWELVIRDFGPGLSPQDQKSIGKKGFTTKQHGLGLGVFLSHSIIERLGGMVKLYNHPEGGLCTHIALPTEFIPAAV